MEEAVTRKFVHEESGSITSLCAAVEACLSQGLRRRALGLFKTSSTTALLHKVGKSFEPAAIVSKRVQEIENADPNRRSSSSGDSTNKLPKVPLQKKNSANSAAPPSPRYLWIRLALFEKQLAKIIDHLVQNSSKYYEKDSLVADPDYGSILSSLLVGPCAVDYSKTKTQDHFWTDPPADELVQRHRISSGHSTPPTSRRPALNFKRSLHAVSSEEGHRSVPISAKDYVESLHQNSRATLLYGKNNVLVLPKDHTEPMPGYLSLHQTAQSLTIKWTPNQLMNGYTESEVQDKRRGSFPNLTTTKPRAHAPFRRSSTQTQMVLYWDYAMNVRVDEIVYVHCHQQADSGGTIVLVGQDGVQRPPIHFPKGGHLLAFLSCLETGLLPHGQLDPPLWSQRGKGKVFPKLRRKGRVLPSIKNEEKLSEDEEESTDYVFRIVSKHRPEDFCPELMDPRVNRSFLGWSQDSCEIRVRPQFSTSTASSTSSSKSLSLDPNLEPPESPARLQPIPLDNGVKPNPGESIQLLCDTMKRQIISRAFYGWLAYCRHLSTVRTHLSGLVNQTIVSAVEPVDASSGVTEELWRQMCEDGKVTVQDEVFRLTYYGGLAHNIRKEVWPYLLGHYKFGSTKEDREDLDIQTRQSYETTMSEWLAVEAIVRQRDKEVMAANIAKLSSESTNGEMPPLAPDNSLCNDVFEDNLSIGSDINPDLEGEDLGCPDSLENENVEEDSNVPKTKLMNGSLPIECDVKEEIKESKESGKTLSPDEGVGDEPEVNHVGDEPEMNHIDKQIVNRSEGNTNEAEQPCMNAQPEPPVVEPQTVIVTTNPSVDSGHLSEPMEQGDVLTPPDEECEKRLSEDAIPLDTLGVEENQEGASQGSRSTCISPASSQGGVYSMELLETFGLNLHRIDKDVQRCDRNYWYFTSENLEKLRNVMCTYVWEHLDIGYMQGMCDLVAPLLVIYDDEATTYACFCNLMERMGSNFPNGGAMDTHFANMRSLIQILDSEMFELMHQNGDYTHFYFCYRWFLLDFKRELLYEDVFSVWETIWAAKHVASSQFVLFLALALVESYRDIILTNSMDFTDIIKFFNEMAERHDAKAVLALARDLVLQLQTLIENK